LIALLTIMREMGLLKDSHSNIGAFRASIAPAGWQRVEALTRKQVISSQAFVAMWFHESLVSAFEDGLAPAIIRAGYQPVRVDKVHHINKVDDQIIAEIRRSRFLVSDFTCEPEKPRGGVYFEAGFAMGLGIPVIWTCKDTSLKDLHFDTRQYNHIVWQEPKDLAEQLQARIGAVIGDGPLIRKI
jgi:nucleoside 2-deoxyribosyltransferase